MDAKCHSVHGFWSGDCAFAYSTPSPSTPPPGSGWKLGLAFALVGLLSVLLSTQHYFAVRNDIEEDTYEPPDRWVWLLSIAVVILGFGVIYYVFTIPLELESIMIE